MIGRLAAAVGEPAAVPLHRIPAGEIVIVYVAAKRDAQMGVGTSPLRDRVGHRPVNAIDLFVGSIWWVEEYGCIITAVVIIETARPVTVDDADTLQSVSELT